MNHTSYREGMVHQNAEGLKMGFTERLPPLHESRIIPIIELVGRLHSGPALNGFARHVCMGPRIPLTQGLGILDAQITLEW
jgi:hypothetical protein